MKSTRICAVMVAFVLTTGLAYAEFDLVEIRDKEFSGTLRLGTISAELESCGVTPVSLRCEQLMHTLGVDVTTPRLGWQIASGNRGWTQTAYRVLVASSPERLAKDEGELWDSGIVKSGDSQGIVYGGKALKSRAHCFWKVKAWDGQGNASAWSQTAEWGMGILSEGEWKGQWIQSDLVLFDYQQEYQGSC
jgi:hypothetical protein